jgi:quercetin dioxygenase-like cupin family protein
MDLFPKTPFFSVDQLPLDFLRPGTARRSIRLGEVLFMFISFDRPTVSPPHDHQWDSIIYIDEGEFNVTVGEEQRQLAPGEGIVVPAGVKHTLTTNAGSRIIEIWYPFKEEEV